MEDGSQAGFVTLEEAQLKADEQGLDLVEVAPGVHKIMDMGRLEYVANKARKLHKQKQPKIKEIQFRLNIGESDYAIKMKKINEFLSNGDKVKVILQLRGREQAREELIASLLERIRLESGAEATEPSQAGRNAVMMLEKGRA